MINTLSSNWPLVISIATVSAAIFSHFKSYMEIKQIRVQLQIWQKQQELIEEQLRQLKTKPSNEFSETDTRIIKPTERQIARFGQNSLISLFLFISLFSISIFLHYQVKNKDNLLKLTIPIHKQNSNYQQNLFDKLILLSNLRNNADSLKTEIIKTEEEYKNVVANYFEIVNKNNQLRCDEENLKNEISNLKIITQNIEDNINRLSKADSVILYANNRLIKAIEDVKNRNKFLIEIKKSLENKLNISIPLLALSVPMDAMVHESRIGFYKASLLSPKKVFESFFATNSSSIPYRFEAIQDGNYIAKMKETDILSIVLAQIELIENFNNRIRSYLETLKKDISSKLKNTKEIQDSNEKFEKEITKLIAAKKKLEVNYEKCSVHLSSLEEKYNNNYKKHESLIHDYSREYNKQLDLLEKIGELRLSLEQEKE